MRNHPYDVFLCHSNADKPAVEDLARQLQRNGLKPWLDKWNLVPGEAWQPEIESALRVCNSCAVCIGDDFPSPWQNEEMRAAIARRVEGNENPFRVIPVLLPNTDRDVAKKSLPAFLVSTTWVEFRESLEDREALHLLVCAIRGVAPGDDTDTASPCGRTQWEIALETTIEEIDVGVLRDLVEHLADLSGDITLTLKKVRRGSVILAIESTREGLERLLHLSELGQFTHLLGFRVLRIRRGGLPREVITARPRRSLPVDLASLIALVRSGDPLAVREVRKVFSGGIRFFLTRELGGLSTDVEVDEIMSSVIESIRRSDSVEPEELTTVVRKAVRTHVAAAIERSVAIKRAEPDPSSQDVFSKRQRGQDLGKALERIPDLDREILTRLYVQRELRSQIRSDLGLSETQFRAVVETAKMRFADAAAVALSLWVIRDAGAESA